MIASIAVRSPIDLVEAFGSVWAAALTDDSVVRIDPGTTEIVARIPVGISPDGITAGFGAIWAVNQAEGTVSRSIRTPNG